MLSLIKQDQNAKLTPMRASRKFHLAGGREGYCDDKKRELVRRRDANRVAVFAFRYIRSSTKGFIYNCNNCFRKLN